MTTRRPLSLHGESRWQSRKETTMPEFTLRPPNESETRRTRERFEFCENVAALSRACEKEKVSNVSIHLKGNRYFQCDHIRIIGAWDAKKQAADTTIAFSPIAEIGDYREPYDQIVTITFSLA